ncbi:hypothetical protein GH714_033380 [Hevea brasiliensis]|uniref:NB-ARC domain-containing protein n=1 Tax=Hevea brasiliensis TaxID=3981 RepID=A0A6A6NDR9_HEVBR|nr:hypothetical protein GH714_033380 [Hevea brasiliensis]
MDDVNRMHNQGHDVIGTLAYACLLDDKGDYVIMHDVIRDMALWIACECGKMKDNFLSQAVLALLQCLNLSMTSIRQLPIELQTLVKLRTSESFIEELQCLQHLSVLSITITRVAAFHRFFSTHRFQSCTQDLSLQLFSGSKSINIYTLKHMKQLHVLRMSDCKSLEELKIDLDREAKTIQASQNLRNSGIISKRFFNSLHRLYVDNCSKLEHLSWVLLAPNLTILRVSLCFEIEEIISAERLREVPEAKNLIPFRRLEVLYLSHLR